MRGRRPRALRKGDRVALVAPASPYDRAALEAGRAVLAARGFLVDPAPEFVPACTYLAGSDAERARALLAALADPASALVWCARGGFGCTRLLPRLEAALPALRAAPPKLLCGFSDVTALHAFLFQRLGWTSVHGPVATSLAAEPAASVEALIALLCGRAAGAVLRGRALAGQGSARGHLLGGNLAVLAALAGTRYFPSLRGAVLLLEDVGERPYRIDRMLTQLAQCTGGFAGAAGVALGHFTECEERDGTERAAAVLERCLGSLGIPVVAELAFGHEAPNLALPHGALAELDADVGTLTLLEDPVDTAVRPAPSSL